MSRMSKICSNVTIASISSSNHRKSKAQNIKYEKKNLWEKTQFRCFIVLRFVIIICIVFIGVPFQLYWLALVDSTLFAVLFHTLHIIIRWLLRPILILLIKILQNTNNTRCDLCNVSIKHISLMHCHKSNTQILWQAPE